MADTTDTTLKNLERVLLKNGRAACPNPECTKSIISEEKEGRAGTSILEYWCENEECRYHKKRVISISISKGILEQVKGGFSTLSKRAITGVIGLFLVIGATLGNYVPKLLGFEKEEDQKLEEFRKENEALRDEVKKLIDQPSIPTDYGDGATLGNSVKIKNQRIAELEKEVSDLKQMMAILPLCESELRGMIKEAEKLMKMDDLVNARKIFERIYDDPRVKNAFLAPENNTLLRLMVKRMADSYSNNLNRFTYNYFKTAESFEFYRTFLDTFPVPKKSIYLGKAYYNYPNFSNEKLLAKESKRLQLVGVQQYLMAARDGRFSTEEQYNIDAINDVLKLYQLFKYQYQNEPVPEDYVTIEMAIENRDIITLKRRIDTLQGIIDKLG
jgi:cell division protein FtsB